MKAFKILSYLLVTVLAAAILGDFCQKRTKGFRLQNIFPSDLSPYEKVIVPEEERPFIEKILSGNFRFMKKGQQCFAFVSEDGKYVLKFLRWNKLEAPFWVNLLNTEKGKVLLAERERKKNFDFTSYKIAYTELKEETGLLFMALGTNDLKNVFTDIYDNIGIKHRIDMSKVPFLLQKKAEDFCSYFEEKLAKKETKDLYPFFVEFGKLLQNRAVKRIADSDITLEYNMGILDGKPLLFDVGNLSYEKESLSEEEFVERQMKSALRFLDKKDKDLSGFLRTFTIREPKKTRSIPSS